MQHFMWGCIVCVTPDTWHLLAFTSINIRCHILSGSQLQDVIQVLVREPWAQLCFISAHYREKLLTKICASKHAQQFCSEGCQVGVTWQQIQIKCVQASCGKFAFKSESHCKSIISSWMLTGRSEGFMVNEQQKTFKSFSSWAKMWKRCSNSRNSPVIFSLNRFMSATCWVAHTFFRQGKPGAFQDTQSPLPSSCMFLQIHPH